MRNICEENCNFQRLCAPILGKFPKNVFAASVVFNKNNIADNCANLRAIFYFCWYDKEIKSKTSLPKLITTAVNLSRSFTSFCSYKIIKVLFIYCTEPMKNLFFFNNLLLVFLKERSLYTLQNCYRIVSK